MISVKNVVKKFGKFTAVNNISFQVKKGEIFAFLGPNGAGKTTTIKMLTTLLHQTSGKMTIAGFDTLSQQKDVRESFGIIFQDPSLDDELTALENMEFHASIYKVKRDISKKRIEHLMKLVGLWDRKDSLVKTFSGGMKRRLEIARGLVHHPKILFLDEPTLGLDPQTRNHIWDYLLDLNKSESMTIFFTTHYMQEAENYSNRVAIIDKGKIIKIGESESFKKSTKTKTLEEAFLKLTGKSIREESSSSSDILRTSSKVWGRR